MLNLMTFILEALSIHTKKTTVEKLRNKSHSLHHYVHVFLYRRKACMSTLHRISYKFLKFLEGEKKKKNSEPFDLNPVQV